MRSKQHHSPAQRGEDGDGGGGGRPSIAISMGDPMGIGPEVIVKALAIPEIRKLARYRVVGVAGALEAAAQRAGIEPFWWSVEHDSPVAATAWTHDVLVLDDSGGGSWCDGGVSEPTKRGGELSFAFVERAIAMTKRDDELACDAIVTAPISKKAWSLAGKGRYPGHTELLAVRFGAKRSAMMFQSDVLNVVLVTAHVPLMALRNEITIGRVFDAIDLGHEACLKLGIVKPRIAVCGLNPHAGEQGVMGDEEERLIEPAIRLACDAGMRVEGPMPADTVFAKAISREGKRARYDLVVAMYHDQGLIPVKLLAWDRAVNVTLGLRVPRTSPDHGTAFDIAGQNKADASSMACAIRLAVRMAGAGVKAGGA